MSAWLTWVWPDGRWPTIRPVIASVESTRLVVPWVRPFSCSVAVACSSVMPDRSGTATSAAAGVRVIT